MIYENNAFIWPFQTGSKCRFADPVNTKHLYNIKKKMGPTWKMLGQRCINAVQFFMFAGIQYNVYAQP